MERSWGRIGQPAVTSRPCDRWGRPGKVKALACESFLYPADISWPDAGQDAVGEGAVDRCDGLEPVLEDQGICALVLEPRGDVGPVPQRAAHVAGCGAGEVPPAPPPADEHAASL